MTTFRSRFTYASALALAAISLVVACTQPTLELDRDKVAGGPYAAKVQRGSFGVVHISANDLPSAAYAQGYAQAQDHVCALADQYLKLRSERALFFGRGDFDSNLESDFGYLAFDIRERAREAIELQAAETHAFALGFIAGYNRYVQDTAPNFPAPCTGAEWITPIDEVDFYARLIDLALLGPARALLFGVSSAQPPGTVGSRTPPVELPPTRTTLASNGWAIGRDRAESGRGALLVNPHFPWNGELRLHEAHLTVPGRMNVYGGALLGVPGVALGFNENVAWMVPFSASQQAAVYLLTLDPSDPTRYLFDGEPREMLRRTVRVEVAGEDSVERTLYATAEHGPIINLEGVGWSDAVTAALAPANLDCYSTLQQVMRIDMATDLDEFRVALAEERGLPWVNLVYADRRGNAYYVDASRVPDLPEGVLAELEARLAVDPFTQLFWESGLALLDGSSSVTSFRDDQGRSRIVPFDRAPQTLRSDFVQNANDAYPWAHPDAQFGEHSPLYLGTQPLARPRTRLALQLLADSADQAPSGADARWSREEIEAVLLRGDAMTANLLRDQVLERCTAAALSGPVSIDGESVDLTPACAALSGWDKRVTLDSAGVAIWREFVSEYDAASLVDAGALFAVGADPTDPIGTPRDLAPAPASGDDPSVVALGRALRRLQRAGFDPAAPLRTLQFRWNGSAIPVPGAPEFEGPLNVSEINPTWLDTTLVSSKLPLPPLPRRPEQLQSGLTERGYLYDYGSSFMLAVEFTDHGPRADAITVYSQSSDPASPYYEDQAELYERRTWRPVRFSKRDIAKDPELQTRYVFEPRHHTIGWH